MHLKTLFACVLLLIFSTSKAQLSDTIISLDEIDIQGEKTKDFSTGASLQKIALATLKQYGTESLSDLLDSETHVVIKSYGKGGLSNTSMRGGGTNHTAIIWNGLNIQSPMNGGVDMSLIHSGIADEVTIQYGGASALHGSGAVGGSIHLNNSVELDKGISTQVSTSFGSFETISQNIDLTISKEKIASKLKIYHTHSQNNYTFKNTSKQGFPIDTLTNTSFRNKGIMGSIRIKTGTYSELNTNIWGQYSFHEVMSTMSDESQNSNPPTEESKNLNSNIKWILKKKKNTFYIHSGYVYSNLTYINPETNLFSEMTSKIVVAEASNSFALTKNNILNVSANKTTQISETANYQATAKRNETALFVSNKTYFARTKFSILETIRYMHYDKKPAPPTISVGAEKTLMQKFTIKTTVSKNFRLPTFNELYWKGEGGSGNTALKSEEGYSTDITIDYKQFSESASLVAEQALFNNIIDKWIIWMPGQNQNGDWIPQNIKKVNNYGMESRVKFYWKPSESLSIKTNLLYSYIVSQDKDNNSENYKKQIIYIPKHKAGSTNSISFKNAQLQIQNNFTGKKYTTADNKERYALNEYILTNIKIGYTLNTQKISIQPLFAINNIFSTNYQIMSGYAMPRINYSFSLTITSN